MEEKTPQQKRADKVREYFQNQPDWRPRAVNLDSSSTSDSSDEFDLSKSFQDLLIAKQAEIALRQANMPVNPITDTANEALETTTALDDSMKQFLRDESNEESFSFARMLNNLNMNTCKTDQLVVNAQNMFERCSPVKMIGLLRPSTVYEEESDSSHLQDSDADFYTDKAGATSFEATPTQSTTFRTCKSDYNSSFMPGCTLKEKAFNNHTDPAKLCFVSATPSSFDSFETDARRTPIPSFTIQENCSETTSCDTVVGRPSAEFSRDSLLSSLEPYDGCSAEPLTADSLMKSAEPQRSLYDTLEMVEYVPDTNNSKYMLKPIRKYATSSSPPSKHDVIEIDSSPETSYKTAHTHLQKDPHTASEICSYPSKKSRTFYGSDFDELCTSLTSTSMKAAANRTTEIISEVINLSDSSGYDENEPPQDPTEPFIQNRATTNTLEDVSSFMTDTTSHSVDGGIPEEFNDSLERAEYMIEQGRLILERQKEAAAAAPHCATAQSPLQPHNQTEFFKTQSSSVLRQLNTNSPKTKGSPLFKKPTQLNITPGVSKKPPTKCRIPKPLSASKIPSFKNIRSPIGIYIKNRPPTEMGANVKVTQDFFDSSYCARASKELNFTVVEIDVKKDAPRSIPRKAYICAESNLFKDVRCAKIPGGDKVHKILGMEPEVVRHVGRIIGGSPYKHDDVPKLADDTLNDFSLLPGDVSVQVLHDLKRV